MKKILILVLLLLLAHMNVVIAPMANSRITEDEPLVQEVIVTYYTASVEECGKSDGITASGVKATEGVTVAADHLDFGTVVIIDGQEYVVQDRFGGNYRNRIDIYTEDKQYAISRGISRKLMIIKEEN